MKTFNKRLVSILLVLAMAMALLPMAVLATVGRYTVAGEAGLCGAAWDPSQNPMTYIGDSTYSITFTNIAAGTYEFKVTDGSWANSWGSNGGNYQITLESACDVTIKFHVPTTTITVEAAGMSEPEYYLRGNMNNWGASDNNKMVKQNDGTYAITMSLEAGSYEYKAAVADWSWSAPGGSNAKLTLEEAAEVTFVLDVAAGTLTHNIPVDYTYYLAGSEELCGVSWDPVANPMTEVAPGMWTITCNVLVPGTYEYKITTGSWDTPSYGDGENNYSVFVRNGSEVTITFNEETKEVTCEVVELGSYQLKFQLNADASADDEAVDLRLITYVESLDFSSVEFSIQIADQLVTVSCDTVYTAIKANGSTLTCEDIFNKEGYLVTFTVTNIPAEYFDTDITVQAIYTPNENNETEPCSWGSQYRTVVLSDIMG
jgi:hypothetical protein